MPRYNDLGAGTADSNYYPHDYLPLYDTLHDSAYEWREDGRMHPTGIFPRNTGRDIDHYNPFGVLDFRPGVGDQQYHPMEEHYRQGIDGRVYNTEPNWGYQDYDDMMAGPDVEWEDNMRWARRDAGRYSATAFEPIDDDPYGGNALGGRWRAPQGGDFGVFNIHGGNNSYFTMPNAPPRELPNGYYLDADDYVGPRSWYPPLAQNMASGASNAGHYGGEVRGDRALRATEVDYWPEW
ncbi:hypothetical protein LTR86_001051 [Recurvomyces mirabilis]|nr:hypothetical protein LTR86_001051 [Recurvomyces mirabilis]